MPYGRNVRSMPTRSSKGVGKFGLVFKEPIAGSQDRLLVGYRWYFPSRTIQYADDNAARFRQWVLALKDGNAAAIKLFSDLLGDRRMWDKLGRPDAFLAVPPHESTGQQEDWPGVKLCGLLAEQWGIKNLASILERIETVPSAIQDPRARNVELQAASMDILRVPRPRPKKVLILDDVTTSGSTLFAAQKIVRKRIGLATGIVCFALGKTESWAKPFPSQPQFPSSGLLGQASELF